MSEAMKIQEVDPRYPVGKFQRPEKVTEHDRMAAIATLAEMPDKLKDALEKLDEDQLNTPYREDGWTVRQLVHHIADSHMNAFVRTRLALTEEWPVISGYDEKAWANLSDSTNASVAWSAALLEGLHARWVMLLQSLQEADWQRGYQHPERGRSTVELTVLLYAWHSRHHVAHITRLREVKGW
jgi:uncharacterized damage-inducible protein DinB